MAKHFETLILSKSLALIEKTRKRVAQVDANEFPTPSSEYARALLLGALQALGDKANWPQMNAEALYNTLIRLQALLEEVEDSTSTHISWPLVSYCDHLWQKLFPDGKQCIFYSVTNAHNYSIFSFTARLKALLKNVLAQGQIDAICGVKEIYCLELASLEDENLPLYANIGHEFGHALFWPCAPEINKLLHAECDGVMRAILKAIAPLGQPITHRLVMRTYFTVQRIAMELFCDLVGARLVGPAFLLSLHEMSWGANQVTWSVILHPEHGKIVSYPSFQFRVDCLKNWLNVTELARESDKAFQSHIKDVVLKGLAKYFAEIPSDHTNDTLRVVPDHDPDSDLFQKSIESNLPALKAALVKFLIRCDKEILASRLIGGEFNSPPADAVAKLLHRLESDVLPNIIPDGTLLGSPVGLNSILNASALFRIHLLQKHGGTQETESVYRDVQKIERLTAKALEVSYIQKEFRAWDEGRKKK
jgi:hypothetical protein